MPLDNNMVEIAIAAMLHDVGKIYERTGKYLQARDELFRYSHAGYTNEFFNEWGGLNIPDLDFGKVEASASYHHNPNEDEPIQLIIQQADCYSAGLDRRQQQTRSDIVKGKSKRPLTSIFSQLQLLENNPAELKFTQYPLIPLQGVDIQFPSASSIISEQVYAQLYKDFRADLDKLKDCRKQFIIDNLVSICRKHMSLVTSSAVSDEKSDISLFDHSLTTAAISCAMYDWHKHNENFGKSNIRDHSVDKFLLFRVDLSGIQDFILDLPNQNQAGIAKILRARSAYLSVLMMGLSKLLLDRLGLPATNCLMNAGGHFTVLAANTDVVKNTIAKFRKDVDRWMHKTFNGKLYINICEPVEFCGSDFSHEDNFKNLSKKLFSKTDRAKKQRLISALQEDGCWAEAAQLLDVRYDDEGDSDINETMKEFGQKLAHTLYITFNAGTEPTADAALHILEQLNVSVSRVPELCENSVMAISVNDADQPGYARAGLANYVPILTEDDVLNLPDDPAYQPGQVMPFNIIASKAAGMKVLAVLKADVDRLGMLFAEGLSDHDYTISRVATLSRMLDGFFTSYLNIMLRDKYPYIYTEYAGGDDLLLIGPWNHIMDFSLEMRQSFKAYTCNNPDINISAGISLMHTGEPVTNALRQADKLLNKMAKDGGRNRIALFNVALLWEDFEKGLGFGKWLNEQIAKERIPSGLVYRLLQYYLMNDRVKKQGSLTDAKWRSQLNYDLARNVKDKQLKTQIEQMFQGDNLAHIKVASTYCLYANRS